MASPLKILAILCAFAGLAACGSAADDDVTRIAFVGSSADLEADGLRLAPAGQHLRAATAEGLVALNASGEVVPALAERWIVTEDGLSYIFRLRNSDWPDGTALSGENIRSALDRNIRQLRGTSLGLDLAIISDIRAMTGRVVEIRLKSPMPQFLQLLAQPELGLRRGDQGNGPMLSTMSSEGMTLSVVPPERSGLPTLEGWEDGQRMIRIASMPVAAANTAFEQGEVDAVLNGHLSGLPYADTGPLARGTVRLDAVFGMFGLLVMNDNGFLADPARRAALALAIERDTLLQPFNIGGWVPTTQIVPPDLPVEALELTERWTGQSIDQRRRDAARRVAGWSGGATVPLTIALPEGPGSDILFTELAADLADVGIILERAQPGAKADLALVDRLARYGNARWFLNQLNCTISTGLCVAGADALVRDSMTVSDPAIRGVMLTTAARDLLDANIYIPIGAPIRWSLVRGGVDGFTENRWGLHPLFPMALRPI